MTIRGRFAHISDCHIGAWREPALRNTNDRAFDKAIDFCIENNVDFVIISGDIFDTGLPEMSSVRSAVRKLRELNENDIKTYVVYGSHDYSPTTVSVVEVLTSAGLFVNVGEHISLNKERGGGVVLRSVIDEKTGVRIAGLPARRGGLEKNFYDGEKQQMRDLANDDKDAYSIFVFHASVNELQSLNIPIEQNISLQQLPKGFSYYAGGHIHKRSQGKLDGSHVVYPGPLFGTSFPDLEMIAKGEGRGFALVDFDGANTTGFQFVDLTLPRVLLKTISADSKSIEQVETELSEFSSKDSLNISDSILLLKVRGTLSSGRSSDIDWYEYRRRLLSRGAMVVNINRAGLFSQESKKLLLLGAETREEIESKLLEQRFKDYKPTSQDLASSSSNSGVQVASKLLGALKTERRDEETKQTFENRIWKEASRVLGIPEDGDAS